MAIRERQGRKKPWEVYWNNPFTLKRESLYVETEEEAKKQDALKKYQLKYERDLFRREENEKPKVEHTFESAYYLFLKDRRFSESALKRHLTNTKRALCYLGNTPLSSIDCAQLKGLIDLFISSGTQPITIKRYMSCVLSVMNWAYENELISQLPRFPKLPPVEHTYFIPPTQEELSRIFVNSSEHIQRVIILGSQMGIRVGPCELFKLKWEDIDLNHKVIHLRAAKKNQREPIRDIPIRSTLIKILQTWREVDSLKGHSFVINFMGKPVQCIKGAWRNALKRAGINRIIRPYDLRHFFATEAIAGGADVGTVAKLMGHTSLTMILKYYQHVLNTQKQAAVEALPEPTYVAKNMCPSQNNRPILQ